MEEVQPEDGDCEEATAIRWPSGRLHGVIEGVPSAGGHLSSTTATLFLATLLLPIEPSSAMNADCFFKAFPPTADAEDEIFPEKIDDDQ